MVDEPAIDTAHGPGIWVRRIGPYAVGFGIILALSFGVPVDRTDEAWFTWVVHRLTAGDAIYRDVYFVSTPLAAWIATAWASVFGATVMSMRALATLGFVAELAVAMSILRAMAVRGRTRVAIAAVLVAGCTPLGVFDGFYTTLAVFFGLVTLRSLVWWRSTEPVSRRARVALVATGVACGCAVASKPNLGALFAVAVVIVLLVDDRPTRANRRVRNIVAVAVGAVAALFATLVPVIGAGHWSSFVDQVLDTKGAYVDVGFSYPTALVRNVDVLVGATARGQLADRVLALLIFLPIAVALALVVAAARARGPARRRVVGGAAFAVAAILGTWPRPGIHHFAAVTPLALTSTAVALAGARLWERGYSRRLTQAAVVGGIAIALVVGGAAISGLGDHRFSRHAGPGVTPAPVPRVAAQKAAAMRHDISTHTDGSVFIVREDAAFWYLTSGAHDPLPYDIPERSDLGGQEQAGVIARLRAGQAPTVCVERPGSGTERRLRPVRLERWVRDHFHFRAHLAACDLYTRR